MGKIKQLDDALSNKIAAGEVVERPASVVKELVENSIDAGSTVIEIDLEEAGMAKIRITDNGDGIEEEDVLVAFKRHATSKIKDENDLFRIRTLGFRGEALPSIASVSRLDMKTSTGFTAGTRLNIEGGKVVAVEKADSRKGTDITVMDLFFNTPARLKYLKTIHTELGNITDVVNRLALSHPDVSFRLVHNGRKLLQTTGNGDVRQVLAAIYGMNMIKSMVRISGESLDYKINGWITLPEVTRASRNYISTMINGRFIKNYPLVKAIQEGYHTLLPIGRFPLVLLDIQMDPLLVDVNVHPSKMEVRLSKEQELNQLVSETIKNVFKTKELIPAGFINSKPVKPKSEQTFFELDHLPEAVAKPKPGYAENWQEANSGTPKEVGVPVRESVFQSEYVPETAVDFVKDLTVFKGTASSKVESSQAMENTEFFNQDTEDAGDSNFEEGLQTEGDYYNEEAGSQEEKQASSIPVPDLPSRVPPLYQLGKCMVLISLRRTTEAYTLLTSTQPKSG